MQGTIIENNYLIASVLDCHLQSKKLEKYVMKLQIKFALRFRE